MIAVGHFPAPGRQASKLVKDQQVLIFFQKSLVDMLSGNAGQVFGDGC